jgi:hypothetical protein
MAPTSYSQNIGVISITGGQPLRGRLTGGLFLVIMAMVPKVGAIIALMPAAVLGGVLLFMFGMVASVGIDIIGSNMRARRDAIIVAASLAVGLGIQAAPPGAFDAPAGAEDPGDRRHRDGDPTGDVPQHRHAEPTKSRPKEVRRDGRAEAPACPPRRAGVPAGTPIRPCYR